MAATTTDAEHAFWAYQNRTSKYEDLAVEYERNIEIHGARDFYECEIGGLGGHCPYCATNVTYHEYTGPDVKNI